MEVLDFRLQFCIRPVRADFMPAGRDGFRRSVPQSSGEPRAQWCTQDWRIAVLPVGHHLVSYLVQRFWPLILIVAVDSGDATVE